MPDAILAEGQVAFLHVPCCSQPIGSGGLILQDLTPLLQRQVRILFWALTASTHPMSLISACSGTQVNVTIWSVSMGLWQTGRAGTRRRGVGPLAEEVVTSTGITAHMATTTTSITTVAAATTTPYLAAVVLVHALQASSQMPR